MSTNIPVPGTVPVDWTALINSAINTQLPINVDITSLDITTTQQLIDYMDSQGWKPLIEVSEHIAGWVKDTPANPAETTDIAVRPAFDLITGGAGGAATNLISGKGAVSLVSKAIVLSTCMALFVSSLTPLGTQEQADYKQAILDAITPFTIDGENVPVFIDEDGKTYLSEAILNGVRQALVNLGTYDAGGVEKETAEGLVYTYLPDNIFPFSTSTGHYDGYRYPGATAFTWDTNNIALRFDYINHRNNNIVQVLLVASDSDNLEINYDGTPLSATSETYTVDNKTVYYRYTSRYIQPAQYPGHESTPAPEFTLYPSTTISEQTYGTLAWLMIYNQGSGGVEGVNVTGKSDFGDLSKTLDDAIQGLADRAIELLNPTDEDMTNKDTWYPANLNGEDVFTDGLDDTQTDPEDNTQGDPDTDSKDEIIDKLLQIIQDITGSPDLPDIPAGDSGDTPPAEPPVLNGSSNGLWTMYNPTKQQVNDFGAWLWSDTLIDQIIRQFNSPIDAVIGFHQIYCTPITGSQKIIKAGYLDSPVSAAEVTNQYVDIDCGQVSVNEYYGNALDYDNTQVSIFLPFVGIVPLNTNVVMGSVLHVIYRIDVFTGTCLAQVKVIKENSNAVMYAFEGNCAVQIPLTGTTYTGMVGALLGGLSASVSFMAGDMYHGAMGALSAITSAGTGLTGVKQSGNMGANAGSLGIRIPYLIITRSASAMPAGFEGLRGIPSTELVTLGSMSGFTSVRDVHLEGIPATAEEINEIKELLSEGVIL